jgi:hypothetical protein
MVGLSKAIIVQKFPEGLKHSFEWCLLLILQPAACNLQLAVHNSKPATRNT